VSEISQFISSNGKKSCDKTRSNKVNDTLLYSYGYNLEGIAINFMTTYKEQVEIEDHSVFDHHLCVSLVNDSTITPAQQKQLLLEEVFSYYNVKVDTSYKDFGIYELFVSDSTLLEKYRIEATRYTVSRSGDKIIFDGLSVPSIAQSLNWLADIKADSEESTDKRYKFEITHGSDIEVLQQLEDHGISYRIKKVELPFYKLSIQD
jgi:hypothetical protein